MTDTVDTQVVNYEIAAQQLVNICIKGDVYQLQDSISIQSLLADKYYALASMSLAAYNSNKNIVEYIIGAHTYSVPQLKTVFDFSKSEEINDLLRNKVSEIIAKNELKRANKENAMKEDDEEIIETDSSEEDEYETSILMRCTFNDEKDDETYDTPVVDDSTSDEVSDDDDGLIALFESINK